MNLWLLMNLRTGEVMSMWDSSEQACRERELRFLGTPRWDTTCVAGPFRLEAVDA